MICSMKSLLQLEAERKAFLDDLKPQMVEILAAPTTVSRPISQQELRDDVAAELAADRAKHRRRRAAHA